MTGCASHPSHPSSVASFQSSHEPHTPPHHAIPLEFIINPNGSFENFSIPTQAKGPFHDSQMVHFSSLNDAFETQPEPEWVFMQRSIETTMHRMPFYSTRSMTPTSGDYSSTLGAGVNHPSHAHAGQQSLTSHPYPGAWSSQRVEVTYPTTESFEWQQPMRTLPSTIVPSEVIRDRDTMNQESNLQGYHDCQPEVHSPGDYYALSHDDVDSQYKSEPSRSEQGDETWTPGLGMMTGEFNAKSENRSSMKERKGAGGKRRSRATKAIIFQRRLNNVDYHYPQQRSSKKHMCRFLLENGQTCASGFERVEHLRRHAQTHQPMRPFICPLHLRPEHKCHKTFGRRDNWRDHLRTHVSFTNAGRNDRIEIRVLFELLKESEEPDEAEKTITMLDKWIGKGGHKKSTSLPGRGRRT
jgi:hypothetical protein